MAESIARDDRGKIREKLGHECMILKRFPDEYIFWRRSVSEPHEVVGTLTTRDTFQFERSARWYVRMAERSHCWECGNRDKCERDITSIDADTIKFEERFKGQIKITKKS